MTFLGVISTGGLAVEDQEDGESRQHFQAEEEDFGVHWRQGC